MKKLGGKHKTQIWAHRGACLSAPENTMEAFRVALDMNADGIELDIHFSKDKELVVLHDANLERVSNVIGLVQDYGLAQLKRFRFNNKNSDFPDAVIPTLREVYDLLKETKTIVNVELKSDYGINSGIEEAAAALTKEMGMEQQVIFSSFNHNSVIRMKELLPQCRAGFLHETELAEAAAYAKWHGVDALHPNKYIMNDPVYVEECKKNGIALHPYTIDEMEELWNCYAKGIQAVITNDVYKAAALRSVWEKLSDTNENIYIWGTGVEAKRIIKLIPDNRISGYIQSDAEEGSIFRGKKVISANSAEIQNDKDTMIVVATVFSDAVRECCDDVGISQDRVLYLFPLGTVCK